MRYLVAPGALFAAALVFAGVAASPAGSNQALQVWRAGAGQTDVPAGVLADGTPSSLSYLKASNADAADAFGSAVAISRDGSTLVVGADLEAGDARGVNGAQDRNDLPGAGAVYVFSRSANGWVQQAYLKAPQPESGAGFGMSVALSDDGHTVVVGAPFESHAQGEGAVHVFRRAHGQWLAQARVQPAAGGQAGLFGWRVALSAEGTSLAVGAREGHAADAHGSVHVFARLAGQWAPASRLEAATPVAGDGFGHSLAFAADGGTLAVGARPSEALRAHPSVRSGDVRVFSAAPSGWEPVAQLSASSGLTSHPVSTEVVLSANGQRLVVGAHGPAGAASEVRVFDRQQGRWTQTATLQSAGAAWGFGERLSLSADGQRLAVSAMYEPLRASPTSPGAQAPAAPEAGAVYVFDQRAGQWTQTQRLNAAHGRSGDLFGSALALSGDGRWLASGARLEDGGASGINAPSSAAPAANSGAVYVYAPA